MALIKFLLPDYERMNWSMLLLSAQNRRTLTKSKYVVQFTSLLAILMGCCVLVGWVFDIKIFKAIWSGAATMKANVALGFILLGIALRLISKNGNGGSRTRISANLCAAMAAGIGLLTLCEYLF